MPGDELLEVAPCATDPALGVDLVLRAPALAGPEPALAREVSVLRREEPAVDVAVERLLADGEQLRVVDHRSVDGLPVLRQAVEQFVEPEQLGLRDVGAPARLDEDLAVVLRREVAAVEALAESAAVLVPAPVADGRGRLQPGAPVLQVVRAVRVALAAELARHSPALEARLADVAHRASVAVGAAVVDSPGRALVGLDRPAPDLAHDGLRRPADLLRYGVGRLARV